MYPRVVRYLMPTLALTLVASTAAAQIPIDVSARLSPTVPAHGRGFCGQFVKGDGANEVGSTAAALSLLDDTGGTPRRHDPDHSFFDIVPLADMHDGADGSTGRQLPYNAFFAWSVPASEWSSESCHSHGGAVGANRFAMRLRADLIVPSAGTYTLAMRSDDGYRLNIGGVTVMETSALRSAATDTRRVSFSEAGTYAIEVVYFENDGHAVFELFLASSEVTFVADVDNAAVATSGGVDLTSRNYDTLPEAFVVMSSAHVTLPTWLAAGDDDCSAYAGQPSTTCTMPASAVAVSCGNGRIDAYSDGGAEACDDGNKVDGDGCSSTCTIEAGHACLRVPSTCGVDVDGDAIPDSEDPDTNDGPDGDIDGDGIPNGTDDDNTDGPLGDIDGDGIPNSLDDDNTDGPLGDIDGDGIPNGVDPTPNGEVPGGGDTGGGNDGGSNNGGSNDGGGSNGGDTGTDPGAGGGDNGEGEPAAQNPGDDNAQDDGLNNDAVYGLSGSGCAATSPSGLTPFGVLAMGLFIARKRRAES